ncbi:hypothetical protein LTR78_001644 [Recurvomyces mirabilis]|uniref:Uncharacterized protein n=1 Tax=Recurvomyces mirabilis TaxID=574656 RepID=A0AAE1C512_9PEZI|nr:hypothetical protein LTR78_001644 [Recurvomyces mirabilis]KAK5151786.1 hypothetical protein LTS14_008918 [Recurvomyces mirabilis]
MPVKRPHYLMTTSDHKDTTPESCDSSSASCKRTTLKEGIAILNAQADPGIAGYGVSTPDRVFRWVETQRQQLQDHNNKYLAQEAFTHLPDFAEKDEKFSSDVLEAWDPKGRYYLLAPVKFGEAYTGIDQEGLVKYQSAQLRLKREVCGSRPTYEMSRSEGVVEKWRRGVLQVA